MALAIMKGFVNNFFYRSVMAGVKPLVALAFSGSIGLLLLFLACALPQFDNWIPFTVVIFYLMSPLPTLIAMRRRGDSGSGSSPCREFAYFLTTGIVVSAFALPIVLARAPTALTPIASMIPSNGTSTAAPNSVTTTPDDLSGKQFTTVIDGGACGLVIAANSIMFLTILGFFVNFDSEDVDYTAW